MKTILVRLLALVVTLCAASQSLAQQTEVDLELVIAVDVSWSMDPDEQVLQREGFAAAFRDEEVIDAIGKGLLGSIAVTYVEWAGSSLQQTIIPWTLIDNPAASRKFADRLVSNIAGRLRRTSISGVLDWSVTAFDDNSYRGMRRVIDVSGDGPNNQGRPVEAARDDTVAAGITINGLPVQLKKGGPGGFMDIDNLDLYYRDCVIGGPGAFTVPVRDAAGFAPAIRRKLILEIAGLTPQKAKLRPLPIQFSLSPESDRPKSDCLIGEKLWNERFRGFDDF